jgi:hypothetical protein
MRRLCGEGSCSYLGRSRLVPERATVMNRREKSAEAVVANGRPPRPNTMVKGRTRRTVTRHVAWRCNLAGVERVAQEVEARLGLLTPSIVVLAVHQPRLLRMQRQAAVREALRQSRQHLFGLPSRTAMTQRIIGVPFERHVRMMALPSASSTGASSQRRTKPGLFAHWRLLWGQTRMGRAG